MLSDGQVQISRHYAPTCASKNFNVVPNLLAKKDYVVYYPHLKFYLQHGMRLSKVHWVTGFAKKWGMDPYMFMNTPIRAVAKNDTEKDFHTLIIKALFGKTCENQSRRIAIYLVNE